MRKFLFSIFIVLALNALAGAEDAIFSLDQDNTGFGGGVDYVSADKQNQRYSRIDGILNVNTDRYNEITKKWGSAAYNTTATPGSVKHRRAYTYNQADGDSYIISQTSNSLVATVGDGSFSTVISTLSDTADCDFTTANDCLYYTDSVHTPGKWNGSLVTNFTIANSTNYPTYCKYITNWHSRNWMTGDTRSAYRNRVYYSEPFVPGIDEGGYENYPIANYIDLGTSDGDTITGIQVANGNLYVYFRYKVFQIVELNTGFYGYNMLSNGIGCLYNTTLDILNGFPVFLSHRGIEQFDGSQFDLKSLPIDFYVKGLRQLKTQQSAWQQTSVEDWDAGTKVDISPNGNFLGDVVINTVTNKVVISSQTTGAGTTYTGITQVRQGFYVSSNTIIYHIYALAYTLSDREPNVANFQKYPDYMYLMKGTDTIASFAAYNYMGSRLATVGPITLEAGTTYYVQFTMSYLLPDNQRAIIGTTTTIAGVTGFLETKSGGVWAATDRYINIGVLGGYDKASFTSQSHEADGWGSWGNFTANETVPSSSTINYYAITATSTYNLTTNSAFLLTNGGPINSTVGPYIQIISSFSRTDGNAIPKLHDFTVSFYGTDNNVPYGKSYKDAYYLAVNTTTSLSRNDCVLVLQKNGDWTRYDNHAGCFAVYRDNLYYGDSEDTGKFYRMEIEGLYTDNGNPYTSYWTSKKINLNPLYKINAKELWITTNGTAGDLDVSYNFNDYTGDWYSDTVTVGSTYGTNVKRLNLLPSTYSRYLQFRVGNSTANDFRIKRLDVLYDSVPAIE